MKPYKIEFYIYASSEDEVKEAQRAAHEFVSENYRRGVIVSAVKIAEALRRFKNNPFIKTFLK